MHVELWLHSSFLISHVYAMQKEVKDHCEKELSIRDQIEGIEDPDPELELMAIDQ